MAKPVILTVDDDPDVLAAISRDLRQHYAADYQIVRAGSGSVGLQTARDLKGRAQPVALFLVDQRMPEMTGTEFLVEASKLFPEARKVLLTAYADTETAIASINTVGLDHYLLKPWNPPVEKLYPVLDDLLAEWTAHVHLPFDGVRVAGSRWSPQSYATKDFLSRNEVPYQWIDIDRDPSTCALVTGITGGTSLLPVVFFKDGSHLVQPNALELAAKVGLQTRAARDSYDVVIVGGGPAGLANAVYGASEGLKTLVVEQNAPGGQAGTSSRIENYLGFPSGVTGADLAHRATIQARRFGAEIVTAREVCRLRRNDPYRILEFADGGEVSCKAVLLATGMAVRMLDAPGIESLTGAGVYYGAAATEGAAYRDQHVCVIGGANSAGQGALYFARFASKVTIVVRAKGLEASMSQYLIERISQTDRIDLVTRHEVAAVCGSGRLEQAVLRHCDTGDERRLDVAAMFIFIGSAPRSDMVAGVVARDEKGFILTGPDLPREGHRPKGWPLDRDPFLFETSVPGIFAAGDVRAGSNHRVAAAVGEGSAAIYSIHKYLETV